jgi:hypothetical protein
MQKSRFTEAHLVTILREAEVGVAVVGILRQHKISRPTFTFWK